MERRGAVVSTVLIGALTVMLSARASAGAQGGGAAVTEGDLEGVVWALTGFGPAGSLAAPAAGSRLDLLFEQGRVAGSSGCNSYAGAYALDGTALGIGALASTQKACPEPLMKQEQEYQRILRAVVSATVLRDKHLRRQAAAK